MPTTDPIFRQNEILSIIRIIDGYLKRVRWCSLDDKKKIFNLVIQRSDVPDAMKEQMIRNAAGTETETDFMRYLKNSKNFYERYHKMLAKLEEKRAARRNKAATRH